MTIAHRDWLKLAEPEFGKTIKILVWRNGDFLNSGHEIPLNPKYFRTWNSVLNFLTLTLSPNFGAIRKLYHLETKEVIECFKDLKSYEKYIAVGNEKFKFSKYRYQTETEKLHPSVHKISRKQRKIENINPSLNFMTYTKKMRRTVIYTMVTGRTCQTPCKIVLTESDFLDWNAVLGYLGYRLDVQEGIQYLCKVNGRIIFRPCELKHGELYVAVPFNGRFVKMDYVTLFEELLPPKNVKNRKVRKIKSSAIFQRKLKKMKARKQTPSVSVFAGSRVDIPRSENLDRCISAKCINEECRIRHNPGITESQVQTLISNTCFDRPIKSYDSLLHQDVDIIKNFDDDSDDNVDIDDAKMYYYKPDLEVIVKEVIDDILENAFLDLEHHGILSPPTKHQSSSLRSFLADLFTNADTNRTLTSEPDIHDQRPMTSFAEIARNKAMQPDSSMHLMRPETDNNRDEVRGSIMSFKKSVSFMRIDNGPPHQETIFEEHEPVDVGIDSHQLIYNLHRKPKSSILKVADVDYDKNYKENDFCLLVASDTGFHKHATKENDVDNLKPILQRRNSSIIKLEGVDHDKDNDIDNSKHGFIKNEQKSRLHFLVKDKTYSKSESDENIENNELANVKDSVQVTKNRSNKQLEHQTSKNLRKTERSMSNGKSSVEVVHNRSNKLFNQQIMNNLKTNNSRRYAQHEANSSSATQNQSRFPDSDHDNLQGFRRRISGNKNSNYNESKSNQPIYSHQSFKPDEDSDYSDIYNNYDDRKSFLNDDSKVGSSNVIVVDDEYDKSYRKCSNEDANCMNPDCLRENCLSFACSEICLKSR